MLAIAQISYLPFLILNSQILIMPILVYYKLEMFTYIEYWLVIKFVQIN